MINYIENGNILKSDAQCLVVTVNTRGFMGKGLALDFKNSIPGLDEAYKKACMGGVFERDGVFIYKRPDSFSKFIVCFPTKHDWRKPSRLEWIEQGLYALVTSMKQHGVQSIAIPALGYGLGGLEWDSVCGLINHFFSNTDFDVEVYLPY